MDLTTSKCGLKGDQCCSKSLLEGERSVLSITLFFTLVDSSSKILMNRSRDRPVLQHIQASTWASVALWELEGWKLDSSHTMLFQFS